MRGPDRAPSDRQIAVWLGPEQLALVLCILVAIVLAVGLRGAGTSAPPGPTVTPSAVAVPAEGDVRLA